MIVKDNLGTRRRGQPLTAILIMAAMSVSVSFHNLIAMRKYKFWVILYLSSILDDRLQDMRSVQQCVFRGVIAVWEVYGSPI